MRTLDCVCDEHLRADNDEGLFERARERTDLEHPELRLGEERLREIVARVAYDWWLARIAAPRSYREHTGQRSLPFGFAWCPGPKTSDSSEREFVGRRSPIRVMR